YPRVALGGWHPNGSLVGMRRKELDRVRRGLPEEQLVHRVDRDDALEVSIASRMIVGPRDRRGRQVVRRTPLEVRFRIAAMEMMCGADSPELAKRGAHVRVVARGEDPAAALTESRDRLAFGSRDSIPDIQREQPEFVEPRAVERCEHRIAPVTPGTAVA